MTLSGSWQHAAKQEEGAQVQPTLLPQAYLCIALHILRFGVAAHCWATTLPIIANCKSQYPIYPETPGIKQRKYQQTLNNQNPTSQYPGRHVFNTLSSKHLAPTVHEVSCQPGRRLRSSSYYSPALFVARRSILPIHLRSLIFTTNLFLNPLLGNILRPSLVSNSKLELERHRLCNQEC